MGRLDPVSIGERIELARRVKSDQVYPYRWDLHGGDLPDHVKDPRAIIVGGAVIEYCRHIRFFRPRGQCSKCKSDYLLRNPKPRIWRGEYVKKPTIANDAAGKPVELKDNEFVKKWPTVLSYLSDDTWDNGDTRKTSTLTLFIEESAFKIALNDRDLEQSVYLTGESLRDVLDATEKCLRSNTADWRPWNRAKKRK